MRRGGGESAERRRWMQITPGVYLWDYFCVSSTAVALKRSSDISLINDSFRMKSYIFSTFESEDFSLFSY